MKYDLESGAHSKYALHYHLILVTKYRRDVFTDELADFLRDCIDGFADNYGVEVMNLEAADDHIHMLFSATPTTDLAKFVNTLKGSTSRRIRNEYGDQLSDKLWGDSFWSSSYCLISTGQVSLDVLKQYVENQRIENA
jgi:putative transposase